MVERIVQRQVSGAWNPVHDIGRHRERRTDIDSLHSDRLAPVRSGDETAEAELSHPRSREQERPAEPVVEEQPIAARCRVEPEGEELTPSAWRIASGVKN